MGQSMNTMGARVVPGMDTEVGEGHRGRSVLLRPHLA